MLTYVTVKNINKEEYPNGYQQETFHEGQQHYTVKYFPGITLQDVIDTLQMDLAAYTLCNNHKVEREDVLAEGSYLMILDFLKFGG